MSKHPYKAVVLDLFDTLVKWEPERLPLMELDGRSVRTTMPFVFPMLSQRLGERFVREHFIEVYTATVNEINAERELEWIEITCADRFARILERYHTAHHVGDALELRRLAGELTRVHMDGVRAVTWAPAERAEAVRRLAQHYRLGLLSNFDDAQCGREVLLDSGVADLFEAVIISAEVGLRKPNQRIYRQMLEMLQLDASDVLFAGDTPREDVQGPLLAGMHTAWISKGAAAIPEGIPAPHFIVRDLSELPALLGV
ncbi:MAG TPA: HAD family hydrolase [Candidatus Binataceae bacterium]|nr:HAD family hydrolase [Candidatus Binataceae bacterium]